jgi:hypothetical protein
VVVVPGEVVPGEVVPGVVAPGILPPMPGLAFPEADPSPEEPAAVGVPPNKLAFALSCSSRGSYRNSQV